METGTVIVLAALALIAIALVALLSRKGKDRRIEREVERRREQRVEEHSTEAETRAREAERLEAQARARRAEADAHAEHAEVHERGLADEDLHREVRADAGDDGERRGRFTRDRAPERDPEHRV